MKKVLKVATYALLGAAFVLLLANPEDSDPQWGAKVIGSKVLAAIAVTGAVICANKGGITAEEEEY